jgi:hypothetical protein
MPRWATTLRGNGRRIGGVVGERGFEGADALLGYHCGAVELIGPPGVVGQRDFVGVDAALGYRFAWLGGRIGGSGRSARFRGGGWPVGLPLCVAVVDESALVVGQGGVAGSDAALGYHFGWRADTTGRPGRRTLPAVVRKSARTPRDGF